MVMSDQAPGDLETVRAFVNTLELETGSDELSSPEALLPQVARGARLWRRSPVARPSSTPPGACARRSGAPRSRTTGCARDRGRARAERRSRGGRLDRRFDSPGGVRLEPAAAAWTARSAGSSRSPPPPWRTGRGAGSRPAGRTVRLGVLRPRPEPLPPLVLDGGLRKPHEGARYRRRHAAAPGSRPPW